MTPRRIILIALLCGVIGGVIGYALVSYVSRIYIEITQPAAAVEARDLYFKAAPYETGTYADRIATVSQRSDRVQYRVRIHSDNIHIYKTCIAVGVFYKDIYYDCGKDEYVFTVSRESTLFGQFYIYVEISGKTTNTTGVITAEITYQAIP